MERCKKLWDILRYAKVNIKYYTKLIPDTVFAPGDTNIHTIFNNIPIIEKKDIIENYYDFIAKELLDYDLSEVFDIHKNSKLDYKYTVGQIPIYVEFTSGSTGTPFISLKSENERMKLSKNLWELRRQFHNVTPRKLFRFMHLGTEEISPFPFEWTDEMEDSIKEQLLYLRNSDFTWWHAYPSILQNYSHYLLRNPMEFPALEVIESNGAYLSDEEREKMEIIFGCKIVNNYGCREVWTIAYGCQNGHLHINEDNVVVELVNDKDNLILSDNTPGNIIVTSLTQRWMPMIRYRLGDIGYYLHGQCQCGNPHRRIALIPGRYYIKGSKKYGNEHFVNVIKTLIQTHGITNFQSIHVIQTDMNIFQVNISGYTGDKECIERAFIGRSNDLLGREDYIYLFTYEEKFYSKSLFMCKC